MLIRERQTYLWNLTKLEQQVSEESSGMMMLFSWEPIGQ